jgi:transcriptional repressor NrdR
MVAKRSGVTEPFTRDKIIRGLQRACQGRPVSEDKLAILAQQVEETIRARGLGEVPSHEVGLAILGPLRDRVRGGSAQPLAVKMILRGW